MASNLAKRVAFAAIAIPVALGIVFWGGWVLVAVVSVAATLGARELYDFARRQGVEPLASTGLVSAAALPALTYLNVRGTASFAEWGWFLGGLWIVGVLAIALWRRAPTEHDSGFVRLKSGPGSGR